MSKLADREWRALLDMVAEATDLLTDEEHDFALEAVRLGEIDVYDYGGEYLNVRIGGRRLLTVHKLVLARSNAVPENN